MKGDFMNIYLEILLLVLSYILGSIPFGLLLGKIKGIDLREVGSKNIGTTNAWRNLGPGLGILTLILDVLKAVIILGLVRYNIIPNEGIIIDPIFYGLAAAIGHTNSIFLKFKGGKAVACTAGVLLVYSPTTTIIFAFVFFVTLFISKYVSLSSMMAILVTFLVSFIIPYTGGKDFITGLQLDFDFVIALGIFCIYIFLNHISNIKRIRRGEERKIHLIKKR